MKSTTSEVLPLLSLPYVHRTILQIVALPFDEKIHTKEISLHPEFSLLEYDNMDTVYYESCL